MKIILLFILAIATISESARAYDEEFSRIISYEQLMSLSPEKRIEYMKNVREALVEFEQIQNGFGATRKGRYADLQERNPFLQMLVEHANAMGAGAGAASRAAATTPPKPVKWPFHNGLTGFDRFCPDNVRNNLRNQILVQYGGHQMGCIPNRLACPDGWTSFGQDSKVRFCQKPSRTSFKDAKAKYDLAHPKEIVVTATRAQVAAAKKKEADRLATLKRKRAARYTASARRLKGVIDGLGTDDAPVADLAESGDRDAGASTDPDVINGTTTGDHNDNTQDIRPDLEIGNSSMQIGTADFLLKPKEDEIDAECKDGPKPLPPDSCSDVSIEKARKDYYTEKEPHCMYGGNLRHYSNNEKKPGKCQRPTEFCVRHYACNDPQGAPLDPNDGKSIGCTPEQKRNKYFMCNPLVFNLDKDDHALCLPQTKDATAKCDEAATAIDKERPNRLPFIARVSVKGSKDRDTSMLGIGAAWNDYAENINKVCFEKPSMNLYCNECQILKFRVAKMNMLAFKKRNTKSGDQCFTMKLFDKANQLTPERANRPATTTSGPAAQ